MSFGLGSFATRLSIEKKFYTRSIQFDPRNPEVFRRKPSGAKTSSS
jgi:hypothetical protein